MPTAAFIQHALDQKKPFALFSTKAKVGLQSTYAERLAARYLDGTGENIDKRFGMAAEAALGADGEMGQIRILANVTHEFMGDTQGMAGTTAFDRDRTDWAGELGMGFACGNTVDGISLHGGATLASDMDEMGTATPPKETLACG